MDGKNFHIQVEETADSTILHLQGELDLAVAAHFRSAVESLIDSDKSVILNLKNLSYIDSTGMGIIIFILKNRKDKGKTFLVESVPPKISRLFDLTGISKFLAVEDGHPNGKAEGL